MIFFSFLFFSLSILISLFKPLTKALPSKPSIVGKGSSTLSHPMEGWRKDLCRSFGYPGSAGYPHAHFQWAQLQVWGLQLKPSQHHITIVCSVVHLFISGYKCIIFQPWTHHFSVTQHHNHNNNCFSRFIAHFTSSLLCQLPCSRKGQP